MGENVCVGQPHQQYNSVPTAMFQVLMNTIDFLPLRSLTTEKTKVRSSAHECETIGHVEEHREEALNTGCQD